MSPDQSYALGKLSQAVWVLATRPGDVRSRLRDAYLSLTGASSGDLPDDLRADYEWVFNQLGKYEPSETEKRLGLGRLDATLNRIRNSTGVKIAERIAMIELELRTRLLERRGGS